MRTFAGNQPWFREVVERTNIEPLEELIRQFRLRQEYWVRLADERRGR